MSTSITNRIQIKLDEEADKQLAGEIETICNKFLLSLQAHKHILNTSNIPIKAYKDRVEFTLHIGLYELLQQIQTHFVVNGSQQAREERTNIFLAQITDLATRVEEIENIIS